MDQVHTISDELTEEGIEHWLDHGTLLGLIREGQLLPSDGDIDLSIHKDNIKNLLQFINNNYSTNLVKKYTRGGDIFKIKIFPAKKSDLVVDIDIYSIAKNNYWRPAIRSNPLYTSKTKFDFLSKFPQYIIFLIWGVYEKALEKRRFQIDSNPHIYLSIDKIPLSSFYSVGTWKIPKEYLDNITSYENLPVPENFNDYLNFRYGNWESPSNNWNTWFDDGGLVQKSPEDLGLYSR